MGEHDYRAGILGWFRGRRLLVTLCFGFLSVGRTQPQTQQGGPPPFSIQLVDRAAEAGLNTVCEFGDEVTKLWIIETTGCGVAFFDYDRDGWLDIFQVNGTTLKGFPEGQEPINHLFRNNRDGTFSDVTAAAGVVRSGWGQGVCAGDFDDDGIDDLVVTYWGQNVLYRNKGDGTFEDVTEKAGLIQNRPRPRWHSGCSFLDYDKDGDLDLFVADYVDLELSETPAAGSGKYCQWKGISVMCGPRGLPGGTNILYQNKGDGTFTDVSKTAGITEPSGYYCFTPLTGDYNNDGWTDVYVTCDSTPNILYENNQDGTFTDVAVFAGNAFNEDGMEQAGMGASAGDYNGDGLLDLLVTNFSDDTSALYRNMGEHTFVDATFEAGLGVSTRHLGWGCGLVDLDNDSWLDIFMANGHVYPELERSGMDPFRQTKQVYQNLRDGTFKDVSDEAGPGVQLRRSSRGVAFGDFDNDGDVDMVINDMHDVPTLLRNDGGNKNNWLRVKVIGTSSNSTGIGAKVKVKLGERLLIDEVRSGGSYVSQSDFRLHFGLGAAEKADRLEVHWPSGRVDVFTDVPARQDFTAREGSGDPGP